MLATREALKSQDDLKRLAAAGITRLVAHDTPIKKKLATQGIRNLSMRMGHIGHEFKVAMGQ